MTARIEARDLTVRYGETTAVDGLSFRLDGGKIHGLLSRNGSGKTSLLSVLAAFRRASDGEVTIDGQPVFETPGWSATSASSAAPATPSPTTTRTTASATPSSSRRWSVPAGTPCSPISWSTASSCRSRRG